MVFMVCSWWWVPCLHSSVIPVGRCQTWPILTGDDLVDTLEVQLDRGWMANFVKQNERITSWQMHGMQGPYHACYPHWTAFSLADLLPQRSFQLIVGRVPMGSRATKNLGQPANQSSSLEVSNSTFPRRTSINCNHSLILHWAQVYQWCGESVAGHLRVTWSLVAFSVWDLDGCDSQLVILPWRWDM